jgi:internalin A
METKKNSTMVCVSMFALHIGICNPSYFPALAADSTLPTKLGKGKINTNTSPESFVHQCQQKKSLGAGDSYTTRDTINYLLEKAGTDDCELAFKKLKSLTTLHLYRVVDIKPLAGLTNLQELTLQGGLIVDIKPLAGLTKLQKLDLDHNRVVDIKPLAGLTNLQKLSLDDNHIIDIKPLAGLTKLQDLNLNFNLIVDVKPLAGLTKLDRLSLHHNRIVDIKPLGIKKHLTELVLSENQIVDVQPLATWRVVFLNLSRNLIVDVRPLASINSKILHIKENPIDVKICPVWFCQFWLFR